MYYKTDSIRNILSNKVTALFRMSAKDVVDIHEICIHENFQWDEVFSEVRQKELGIEPSETAEIISGFPKNAFDSIKWIHPMKYEQMMKNLEVITKDMLGLSKNSLA